MTSDTTAPAPASATPDTARTDAPQSPLASLIREAGNEFITTGALSDARYAEFEAHGINRNIVDAHIDGLLARIELRTLQVFEAAGGQEQFNAMSEWAVANLPAEEFAAITGIFASGDMTATLSQVENLRTRYDAANSASAA